MCIFMPRVKNSIYEGKSSWIPVIRFNRCLPTLYLRTFDRTQSAKS